MTTPEKTPSLTPSRNLIRLMLLVAVAVLAGAVLASRPSTDPEAMARQIKQYSDNLEYDKALQTAQDALDIVKNGGYPDAYTAKFYLLRAQMWMNVYEWDFALSDFDSAIALAPTYPEAYYLRGLFYANLSIGGGLDQLDLAIADFEQVVALDPNSSFAANARTASANLQRQKDALSGS